MSVATQNDAPQVLDTRRVLVGLPSFREGDSAAKVLLRLDRAVAKLTAADPFRINVVDILYADDSTPARLDDKNRLRTDLGIRRVLQGGRLSRINEVSCYWRGDPQARPDDNWGGLGGAVVDILRYAKRHKYDIVVIMDSDGQHPASLLPDLVEGIEAGHGVVVPSRYIEGGSAAGLSDGYRRFVSRNCARFVKAMFPFRLRGVSDPLGGFFAVKMQRINPELLTDIEGWKVLFETLVKHDKEPKGEVPYSFEEREEGESNARLSHGVDLLRQVMRLRWTSWPDWFRNLVKFSVAGGLTSIIGAVMLWFMVDPMGAPLHAAVWTELIVTLLMNFWYYQRSLWPGLSRGQLAWRLVPFFVVRFATMWGSVQITVALTGAGLHYQLANLVGLLAGMTLNYPATWLLFEFRRVINRATPEESHNWDLAFERELTPEGLAMVRVK